MTGLTDKPLLRDVQLGQRRLLALGQRGLDVGFC